MRGALEKKEKEEVDDEDEDGKTSPRQTAQ